MKQGMMAPRGCCDDHDPRLAMAHYMVHSAFKEALRERPSVEASIIILGMARMIAIELLEDDGMSRDRAREFVNEQARLLEKMTDQMAREAGLA
jgi:hypothetical protein